MSKWNELSQDEREEWALQRYFTEKEKISASIMKKGGCGSGSGGDCDCDGGGGSMDVVSFLKWLLLFSPSDVINLHGSVFDPPR